MYRIITEYDLWVVGMLGNMYHTLSFEKYEHKGLCNWYIEAFF